MWQCKQLWWSCRYSSEVEKGSRADPPGTTQCYSLQERPLDLASISRLTSGTRTINTRTGEGRNFSRLLWLRLVVSFLQWVLSRGWKGKHCQTSKIISIKSCSKIVTVQLGWGNRLGLLLTARSLTFSPPSEWWPPSVPATVFHQALLKLLVIRFVLTA